MKPPLDARNIDDWRISHIIFFLKYSLLRRLSTAVTLNKMDKLCEGVIN